MKYLFWSVFLGKLTVQKYFSFVETSKMLGKVFISEGSKTTVDDQIAAVPARRMM